MASPRTTTVRHVIALPAAQLTGRTTARQMKATTHDMRKPEVRGRASGGLQLARRDDSRARGPSAWNSQ